MERDEAKLRKAKMKLALLEAGGSPERPLEVTSASVIEVMAASLPCASCGGKVRVDEHTAEHVGGRSLRAVLVKCVQCGDPRRIWFKIGTALPN